MIQFQNEQQYTLVGDNCFWKEDLKVKEMSKLDFMESF